MSNTVHFRTCPLCEAMCGLRIESDGARVSSIRGDDEDSFSQGYLCPKATALKDLHEDPDRLRQPMKRVGTEWHAVSWDEALDEAAQRLHAVQRAHGNNAVAAYIGNPATHNTGALLYGPPFLRSLRTHNKFSASSVDQLPHMLAARWMFGHQLLLPVPDIDRTHFFLILGANPLASNGSLMTAPGMRRRLDAIKARGGTVAVIDPRKTETAERATEHHFIRPGTDAALLLALIHEVIGSRARKPHHLDALVTGLDVVKRLVEPWTAERASASTEIPADTIRSLAQRFSSAPSAVCYGRIGTSVQAHGTVCAWLINVLNITTGNFDVPGGAMFPMPPFDPRWLPKAMSIGPGSYARRRTRVRSLPEAGGEFPVAALAEEILQPGPGQIRALVTFAGNPVLSTPNGTQLDRALEGLDVMISIDPYLNETTRHAHFILPPPSPLERLHFDVVFPMLAVRTVARHAEALFDPGPNARQDWQILAGLARRLARLRRDVRDRAMWRALETLGPRRLIDAGLRLGRFGGLRGLSLAKVAAHHHGLDLGPLEPALASKLRTPSGRLELAPKPLVDDVSRLEAALNASSASLVLINRRHQRDNNSWLHNVPKLVSGASRCTLLMHPEDAKRRNLVSGSWVGVRSRVGEIIVPIEVTDSVMPGVVSLPHGYGHSREGVRLRVATGRSGASVNDLSDELRVDTLSGNAAFSGLPVTVEPRDVPPISDGNGLH